jgi:hypothetical protein
MHDAVRAIAALQLLSLALQCNGMAVAHLPSTAPSSATPMGRLTPSSPAVCSRVRMAVDVSDLGLTMEDLNEPLPDEITGEVSSRGYERTSRLPDSLDRGIQWYETADRIDATLNIPGLRGQPAAALTVELTATTATVTAFGMPVWSCILRGEVGSGSTPRVEVREEEGMPMLAISVSKQPGASRWGGFARSIGEDSILQ